MNITAAEFAKIVDISCVKANNTMEQIIKLAETAIEYNIAHVSTLPCYVPKITKLLNHRHDIIIIGNVAFPSGGETTAAKVFAARELISLGCREIDMVMNIGALVSGDYREARDDIKSVTGISDIPVKVIIESPLLNEAQIRQACEICIESGAAFVKTGTGWNSLSTKLEDVAFIKSIVGDRIRLKVSGGVRDADSVNKMARLGADRFGVNMDSCVKILQELQNH